MKKIFNFAIFIALSFAFVNTTSPALANCQTVYGGGQTCSDNYSFTVNKLVQVPGKGGGQFVDNLLANDPKYSPSQNANYEIVITNTGSQTIPSLNVTDTFPQYLTFVSGAGNYNKNTNTLNFTINNLDAGKSLTYVITVRTADSNSLPNAQGITCVTNQVSAVDTNGNTNSDSSQLCILKNVLSATPLPVAPTPKIIATPATGPEMLPLLGLIPGAIGGLMLRKKSKNIIIEGGEK